MSIRKTKQTSSQEKRFQQLHTQIYGKQEVTVKQKTQHSNHQYSINTSDLPKINRSTTTSEVIFLKQDLLKIFILSVLAIGAEFLIYYLSNSHIINLNFQFIT